MALGTSLPELFVSLTAALGGSPGIAIGNVVGSNIANVGLILGFGALVGSLHVQRNITRSDLPLGVLTALLLILWIGPTGEVSRLAGAILLVLGLVLAWSPSIPLLGKLPGDLRIERPGFRLYVPLASCLLLSVVVSAVLWLVSKLR